MLVTRTIDIAVPPDRVWALVTDPERRARLNPAVRVIAVEIEDGQALHRDSVTRYRLEIGGRITEYRTRVRQLVPHRRLVAEADAALPFETTLELQSLRHGTRLIHSEQLEPSADMIQQAINRLAEGRQLGLAERFALWMDGDASERLRDRALEDIERSLGDALDRWLAAIRADLESSASGSGPMPA
jgi:uncharacterized protein YndB with AHSA1/START domain